MDVWEALQKRRTVRAYKAKVPDELLRRVILSGTWAPSGGNSQPWEFIHVTDPALIDQIAEQKYQMNRKIGSEEAALRQKMAYQNASVVAVCCKKGSNVAAWMAALNMELALTAEGMAGVMSTLGGEHKEAVQKLLGLLPEYELATVMVMGVPVSWPTKREGGVERPDFSWLHVNRFGNPG